MSQFCALGAVHGDAKIILRRLLAATAFKLPDRNGTLKKKNALMGTFFVVAPRRGLEPRT